MSTMTAVFPLWVTPENVSFDHPRMRRNAGVRHSDRVWRARANHQARLRMEVCMDALVNQLARELADAISAAVHDDRRVEACREKARAAGLELRVSLEAVIGFGTKAGA